MVESGGGGRKCRERRGNYATEGFAFLLNTAAHQKAFEGLAARARDDVVSRVLNRNEWAKGETLKVYSASEPPTSACSSPSKILLSVFISQV